MEKGYFSLADGSTYRACTVDGASLMALEKKFLVSNVGTGNRKWAVVDL
nr:hypothetical protein [Brevibacillus laterosporus]